MKCAQYELTVNHNAFAESQFVCILVFQCCDVSRTTDSCHATVDIGGGTLDVCVHQLLRNGRVRNLCPPTGFVLFLVGLLGYIFFCGSILAFCIDCLCRGPFGSTYIDAEFFTFLSKVFGDTVMTEFRRSMARWSASSYVRSSTSASTIPILLCQDRRLTLPTVFPGFILKHCKMSVEDMLKKSEYKNDATLAANGNLRISNGLMMTFFKPVVDNIIAKLKSIHELEQCVAMFVVGGFGMSDVLMYVNRFYGPCLSFIVFAVSVSSSSIFVCFCCLSFLYLLFGLCLFQLRGVILSPFWLLMCTFCCLNDAETNSRSILVVV